MNCRSSEQCSCNSRSSPQSSVLYTNSAVSGSQIRLLKILSTHPDVSCELNITELDGQAEFNALSYVWGDPSVTETIYVNGNKVQVTTNLASALRHTPHHLDESKNTAGKRIWVDAICINQDDGAEKTHQVSTMGRIYSQSGIVLCWLGLPTDSIVAAIDAVETVAGKRFIHDTHMKNYKNHYELTTCIQELQGCLEKTKMYPWLQEVKEVVGESHMSPAQPLFDLSY
ncbi:heterokaryon incompatibility protein-domain-containing protein, partial [Fusarium tricinctum]